MTYPKWVNRGLGDSQVILCTSAEEEAEFVGQKPAEVPAEEVQVERKKPGPKPKAKE